MKKFLALPVDEGVMLSRFPLFIGTNFCGFVILLLEKANIKLVTIPSPPEVSESANRWKNKSMQYERKDNLTRNQG